MKFITQSTFLFLVFAAQLDGQVAVPQPSPYSIDANTVLLEHFDNSTTGAPSGVIGYATGIFGRSVKLTDTSLISWNFGSLSQGTVEFWFKLSKLTNTANTQEGLTLASANYLNLPDALTMVANANAHFQRTSGGSINVQPFDWVGLIGNAPVAVNRWYHYAMTWGQKGVKLYLNGNFVGANPSPAPMNPSTGQWAVGAEVRNRNDGFNGTMDELRISNIARTFKPALITIDDANAALQYDGWRGFQSPSANGGTYRMSNVADDIVRYAFNGNSLNWITRSGPNMGIASVTIDGVSKGNYDMYSATVAWKRQILFANLGVGPHAIVIQVTGTKNTSATDFNVAVDGFLVGGSTTVVQDSAISVQYNNWIGKTQTMANGGSYRIDGDLDSTVRFKFNGKSVHLITARGPSYGMANVYIDGVLKSSNLDLYSATQEWQYALQYSGLTLSDHIMEVQPTHTKNVNSSGYEVVLDAFAGTFTPLP